MPNPSPAGEFDQPHGLGRVGTRLRHPFRRQRHRAESVPGHVVVRISGEITAQNAARIGRELQDKLRSHPSVLEIDLGRVTHLSGDGAEAFFMAVRSARAHGTRVITTHTRPQARGVLNQLGLLRVLDVYNGDGPDAL